MNTEVRKKKKNKPRMEILSRLKSTYTNENGENVFLFCSFMSLTSQNLLSKGFSAAEKKNNNRKMLLLCAVCSQYKIEWAERCMKRSNVTNSCINVCFHSKSGDLLALSLFHSLSLSLSFIDVSKMKIVRLNGPEPRVY